MTDQDFRRRRCKTPSLHLWEKFLDFSLPRDRAATICRPKTMPYAGKTMIPLRLELRTACVLDRSDNQLHHRTIDVKILFSSVYNVLSILRSVH
jgi:hypothetical protein